MVAGERLLQRLEEAVGRARIHRVRVVDHDHPRPRLVRPRAGQGENGADVVDDDLPTGAGRTEARHVGVEARLDAAANLASAAAGAGRDRTVERHRQPERGVPLADAGGTLEHVGVRDAPAGDRTLERSPRQILADEVCESHRRNLTHGIARIGSAAVDRSAGRFRP